MNGAMVNEGVQVLKLGEGSDRYELDEDALQRILLHPAVRDLPVVVVSIAGAFRGGKSFILDFFLRYLKAPRSSQLNGEWMGQEDEPLKGFHWRGGGDERDTTGIHLWPEPIITTMENGEKVAVLLMDTQGTFDTETPLQETSIIIALSTLMSSVQIYNLSGNIKEDDLQHLQLFIEYGKLVSEHELKAFQTLLVLVRDWEHYDHEHGYGGGRELLNKRLQFKQNQKKELMEIRQHIRSCFEKIECFLMPYPGKLVTKKKTFNGCLRDIDEDFKEQLRDFVPSIFDPKHLTPKTFNGEQVTARALLVYFQKCVETYNGDGIPEATTIYKAMSEASMVVMLRSARELYEALMDGRVRDTLSVPEHLLSGWLCAAEQEALHCYEQKKKLGSQEEIDYHLNELKKELERRRSLYMWKNAAKVRKTTDLARKSYDEAVNSVCTEQARLCLHPLDLHALHGQALEAALVVFDSARDVPEHDEDEDRAALVQSLEELYDQFRTVNEQNNRGAVMSARDVYATCMKLALNQAGVSANLLHSHHQKALEEARTHFNKERNRITEQQPDNYMNQLLEEMNINFKEFENMNINSNRLAMQAAEFKYNSLIKSAWGPQSCCFHPLELEELHKIFMDETIKEFVANRTTTGNDEYVTKLTEVLEARYLELKKNNEFNNEQAVELAVGVYRREMDKHTQSSVWSVLVIPFLKKLLVHVPMNHKRASELALEEFYRRRRGGRKNNDKYVDKLKKIIQTAYGKYSDFLKAVCGEICSHTKNKNN